MADETKLGKSLVMQADGATLQPGNGKPREHMHTRGERNLIAP
jgi:hypothetical protein